MTRITSNIKKESFPYLLIILFGIVSWGISHFVDRLSQYPIVAYEINRSDDTIVYTIKNVSSNSSFRDVTFLVMPSNDTDSLIFSQDYIPAPVALDNAKKVEPVRGKSLFQWTVSELQPKCTILIKVLTHSNRIPPLRFYSSSTIYLHEESFETWLLENEIFILTTLISTCCLLITIYLFTAK